MKSMGLMMGPAKPEAEESEGAPELAMKAFVKALKGSDAQAQVAAFRELMACCSDDYELESDDEE